MAMRVCTAKKPSTIAALRLFYHKNRDTVNFRSSLKHCAAPGSPALLRDTEMPVQENTCASCACMV